MESPQTEGVFLWSITLKEVNQRAGVARNLGIGDICVNKSKIQLGKSEDLMGFIHGSRIRQRPIQQTERSFQEDCTDRRRSGKDVTPAKNGLFQARSPSFGGRQGSIRQMTSLVLTGLFQIDWLNVTFLGEAETAVRLGTESWFAHVGLCTCNSIWGLLLLCFNTGLPRRGRLMRKEN